MTSKVKNIIFDLGNVLFTWAPEEVLTRICSPKLKMTFNELPDAIVSIWREFDRGKIAESDLRHEFAMILNVSVELVDLLLDSLKQSLNPIPETVTLLHRLHYAGHPLYCLSNISTSFGSYLRNRNYFFTLFTGIIFSAEVKTIKPELEIYRILCNRYRIRPHESIFIDDRIENIKAAENLGFHTILFTSYANMEPKLLRLLDYSIPSVSRINGMKRLHGKN